MRRLIFSLVLLCGFALQPAIPRAGTSDVPTRLLRGDFVQERHLSGLNAPLISKGHYIFSSDLGLIWRVVEPIGVTTVLSPRGGYQRRDGAEAVSLPGHSTKLLEQFQRLAVADLSSDATPLTDLFEATRQGDAENWQLVLIPRSAIGNMVPGLERVVVSGGKRFEMVSVERRGGEADRIHFGAPISGQPLTADEEALFPR
jgi:hypothetical protein